MRHSRSVRRWKGAPPEKPRDTIFHRKASSHDLATTTHATNACPKADVVHEWSRTLPAPGGPREHQRGREQQDELLGARPFYRSPAHRARRTVRRGVGQGLQEGSRAHARCASLAGCHSTRTPSSATRPPSHWALPYHKVVSPAQACPTGRSPALRTRPFSSPLACANLLMPRSTTSS